MFWKLYDIEMIVNIERSLYILEFNRFIYILSTIKKGSKEYVLRVRIWGEEKKLYDSKFLRIRMKGSKSQDRE